MSPTNTDHIVTENTNIDQKMFILEIVGGVIFVLLVMLCFLVHYFRRKCMKPRQLFNKLRLPSTFRDPKIDQSTSMSYLSLEVSQCESEILDGSNNPESSGHQEVVIVDVHVNQGCSVESDLHTPVLQHTCSTSKEFSSREELPSHQENDQRCMSLESMATFLTNGRQSLEKTEGDVSPDKENYRHNLNTMSSQSLQQQASFQVELRSPRQMQSQHLAAQALSLQHLQEAGTGDWKPEHVVMSESMTIPQSLSDELLAKKGLTELGGRKPLPHPEAWFVSLDGRSKVPVRHSYIDLQPREKNGINNSSLDSGNGMNEQKQQVEMYPQNDLDEVDQGGREYGTAVYSPENNTPRYVLDGGRRRGGQLPSLQEETKRDVENPPEPLPSTECKITEHHEASCDGSDSEDKKTPWEKREERPVLAFTLK